MSFFENVFVKTQQEFVDTLQLLKQMERLFVKWKNIVFVECTTVPYWLRFI